MYRQHLARSLACCLPCVHLNLAESLSKTWRDRADIRPQSQPRYMLFLTGRIDMLIPLRIEAPNKTPEDIREEKVCLGAS